ncbi:EmrB/QacA subfamily drug resistance transporter [Kribbella voronezhensis]|uniref:EmrB/QacA subfamily drug resistance transporter n=1 Tax=Kribbella voronezhensis TaxID=2512212 RepID=A0A4V3FK76_9ACTN|nr:MDR family MFS transporter [Kribbella voronezhensis]TDU89143.1 EmrB/QacA subfamily drug resistance transporter [Kribbella voronezhensis]
MSATQTLVPPAGPPAAGGPTGGPAGAPADSETAPTGVRADPELTHREILEILAGLLAALFTAVLSSTIVSNALPTIIADLEGTQTQYTWVITASLLAMTVSTPVWGKLSDLMSKKLLVQLAIVLFVIGSALAGMAHNVPFLIGARVLQGLAMGGLMALAQAIIGAAIPPRDRGRYSGYMGAVVAVATVSGPLLGGVIVDTSWLGWRWCFYVCVPLAVLSLIVLQRYLHLPLIKRKVKMDYAGALLISAAASLPLIWVTFAGDHFPWWSRETAAFLGGAALLAILAIVVESKASEPLVPLKVVRERTTALAILASLAVGVAMFGSAVFLGQYFQIARGYSATEAGLLTIPMMFGSFVGSVGAGQLITRFGKWKRYLVLGGLFLVAGLAVLGTIDHTSPYWYVGLGMLGMGMGMGMMMQNLVLAVQNTVDVSEVGAASASVTFFRSLGGAVGVSVLGAVLATRVTDLITSNLRALGPAGAQAGQALQDGSGKSVLDVGALPPQLATIVRHAYGDATGRIFAIAAGAALVSLLAVLFIREVPLRRTVAMTDPDAGPADGLPEADLAAAAAPGAGSPGVVPVPDDDASRAAAVALDVIASAERTALEREREATERVHAAATVIRQMRTDVADLFTRVDQQLAELEQTLPGVESDHPMAPVLDTQREQGALVGELRRYELSVLSASQRTADHLRETAKTEADELLAAARLEEEAIRQRIAELEAVEVRLLGAVRDGLSATPPPPAAPPQAINSHRPDATVDHGNGYPTHGKERQAFG